MTPLFETLGCRVINGAMNRTMAGFLGAPGLIPEEPIVAIHGYAYYYGAFTLKQIGQILWGSVGIVKRMFTGIERRHREALARYEAIVREASAEPWRSESTSEILRSVPDVLGAAIDYYLALVAGLIPAAWITEALFTGVYKVLIKRRGDPRAPVYLLGYDSAPILAEKALYDLAQWAREDEALAAYLLRTPTPDLVRRVSLQPTLDGGLPTQPPSGVDRESWSGWDARFAAYLDEYGATIYDLDIAKPTPAGDPTPVVETFKLFLRGEGTDPYRRQRASAARREAATAAVVDRLKGLRLKLFERRLSVAQRYAPQREDGLATLGLGYPLLRAMLLEVGQKLASEGIVAEADDIFWLFEDELNQVVEALENGRPFGSLGDAVGERKALWQARKRVTPPMALPLLPKFMRSLFPALGGAEPDADEGGVIRGTACSPGTVTATARVLSGPQDFDEMRPGEVLVAGITTPAWTPLFAMASAVVTDIGGPLSHGSIVAREYGIPAVLGTGGATRRIKSGDRVRVDGTQGTVQVVNTG
jgi:pyruvate,water dikinase